MYENTDELRRIQILSTLFDGWDRVCTFGISYQAYGGTAIGADEAQGFIPLGMTMEYSRCSSRTIEIFLKKHLRSFDQICIQNGRKDRIIFPAAHNFL